MAVQSTSVDEPPDDVTVVGELSMHHMHDLTLQSGNPVPATLDDDAKPSKEEDEQVQAQTNVVEEQSPHGLTDQTNFLPTKQVIMVFLGLSVALACSFLDQTMYVLQMLALMSS